MNNNMQNQNQNQNQTQGQMQNQNHMQNQNQMAMLSSKNLTILEDQMTKEALGYKKMNVYSNECNDQQLKNVCQKAAQMHKKHFDTLYNYLNSHNKPMGMQ